MNSLVNRTTMGIWCQSLARAGFQVQTTANDDRRLTADRWDLWHMNSLVDRTTIWIWRQILARTGFPVETTADFNRRVHSLID